jgi:hypothetical protein
VTPGRAVIVGVGAVVIFAAGIGLGQALDDNEPGGSGTQTFVRTLDPLSLPPAARTTVTVTTTAEP